MCIRVLSVAERGLGRGQWEVGDSVGSDVCVGRLDVGKRVVVCMGSWQACKMPGMIMCWRLSWWR